MTGVSDQRQKNRIREHNTRNGHSLTHVPHNIMHHGSIRSHGVHVDGTQVTSCPCSEMFICECNWAGWLHSEPVGKD